MAAATRSPSPQQRRADDSALIGPLGATDTLDSLRLAALGRSPYGRGQVRLEWEVKPFGVPESVTAARCAFDTV